MSGTLLLPAAAYASLLSALFGSEKASANLEDKSNSQTISLLQANVSSTSILDEKGGTGGPEVTEKVNILSDNALVPATSPLGVSDGKEVEDFSSDQVSVYVVHPGDTISQIAEMFDVSVSTILSANDMKKGQKLTVGQVLVILPISGVEHTVVKGDTLQSIAKKYGAEAEDIALYNGLAEGEKLAIGDEIIIPGGEMDSESGTPSSNLSSSVKKDQNYYATHPIKDAAGYFINPLPTGTKTQGLHGPGRRGIDIGAPTGTPIYASAAGTVLIAKTGWSGGYGNMVIIQHPNGTKTLYAHMSKLGTTTGATVSQGDVIGYVGSTGHSTGPHLHFEVFNAKNPGADWSWKK